MLEKNKKIIIILSTILLIIILLALYINKNISQNKLNKINNKTYYEVTLKPSIYFPNDKIKAHNYYIASSIKNIDIYFNYYIKNKEIINYSYDITATLKSYADNGTKLVWTKDFNLKNINNINAKEINIKENYNLDYEYYVNYIKSFQEYYNIKTETYLYVNLNIKINDKIKPYISLTIPLSENVSEITMKEDNSFLENNNPNTDLNKIISFIFIVIVITLLISKILFHKENEDVILKEYQDIIITIQNNPNINDNNIIYLTNLKDLINIALNNNTNIFNYQNNYYIIIDNTYYTYILKNIKRHKE